ncbi:hypothetical protein SAJA_11405 [Salinisphaera japonica YTM-1]|uniref:Glycosyltransferase 2-like domain-containing protein n=1 Tax=Salinisphaera japonica YTM-1 TaxID=1209778 RepID=A0A423PLA5_9GAMM|nr:hypothetical protein SAJA_11405 [Salinisphaera japonica YTM-1]
MVSQNYGSIEIICVDDGSTDDTLVVAQRCKHARVVRQSNQGACVARNRGIAECSGKYVKFLDADDFLLPGAISQQVNASKGLSDMAISYGNYIMRSESGEKLVSTSLLHKNLLFSVTLQDITTSTPLHRRKLLEYVGGFDANLRRGQEWNLHVRLAAAGVNFVHDETPIYTYCNFENPHRVSRYSSANAEAKYAYKITQVDLTADALADPVYVKRAVATLGFARRLWGAGRDAFREGEPEIADQCFRKALAYCGDVSEFLPAYYRIPSGLIGRERFERLISPRTIGKLAARIERGMWRRL